MPGLQVEDLQFDAGGAPYSARYGDVYGSRSGALGQAMRVFLHGNELPSRWAGREQFVIVETGFGLGINFLATWQAWREDVRRPRRLHFVSVERHPVQGPELTRWAPPPLAALAAQLAGAWPPPVSGLHRLSFESDAVTLTLGLGDARTLIPQLMLGADAFYLDGFAPDRNPQMWEAPLLKALARLARPGATLATWSTARAVREALSECGFEVALREGFGAKRQMLTARYAPRYRTRRLEPSCPYVGARHAVVIGAGLAGCSVACALARRSWQVDLLEAAPLPAGAASALPAGLLHPTLSIDDNHAARLLRAGFLLGRRQIEGLQRRHPVMLPGGVLQIAADEADEARWPELLRREHWPEQFVRWCEVGEAGQASGLMPRRGGLWFVGGAAVSAQAWCRAMLADQPAIRLLTGWQAVGVHQQAGSWRVERFNGAALLAPLVVVAASMQAPGLLQVGCAPVRPIRGRITRLARGELAGLKGGIAGQGYLVPGPDGRVWAGATFETMEPDQGPGISEQTADQSNLLRLTKLLAQPAGVRGDGGFDAVRCVAKDRNPLAGPVGDERAAAGSSLQGAHLADLPRHPGLFCSFALGSRGLTLAPLLAELIAAQVEGEPAPIERALAASIDPARFLLRRLRRH